VPPDTIDVSIPVGKKDTITHIDGKTEYVYTPIVYKNKVILDNDKAKVTVNTNKKGNLDFNVLIKEKSIKVQTQFRYKKDVVTNRKLITITNWKRGFFWWSGVIFWSLFTIGVAILIISSIRRVHPLNIFKRKI